MAALPRELINEFVKMTKDDTPAKKETNTFGTVVRNGNTTYVKLDGADVLTPVVTTTNVEDGERVTVMIKNHTAVVTGNITSPSARTAEVESVSGDVSQVKADIANVKILMADKVSTEKLEAQVGRIDELESKTAAIDEIKAQNVEISGKLTATEADIKYLKSDEAFIKHLNAITAKINEVVSDKITTDEFYAALADITVLAAGTATFDRATVKHLVAQSMNLEYGVADQVFIKNLAVEFAQVVSASVGELCIKASDGNYYLLDVGADGSVTATKTTVSNSEISAGETSGGKVILETNITAANLNTSNLLATYALINKIDAARIDVDQLFAREAVINLLRTTKIVGDKTLTLIVGDVEDAKSVASSAQSTANSASQTASNAQSTANAAQTTANSAQSAASNAQSTANAAQTTANNAQASANNLNRLSNIEVIQGTFAQVERRDGEGIRIFSEFGPKQDLTYGNPYPAGGGKNLIPSMNVESYEHNGIEFVRNTDGSITVNGTATGYASANSDFVDAVPLRGKTLTIKGGGASKPVVTQVFIQCASGNVYKSCTGSNMDALTFVMPDDANTVRFEVYVSNGQAPSNLVVYPQLELGSTATSYAPYANICPIEGRADLNAAHSGKNLLKNDLAQTKTNNGIDFTFNADGSVRIVHATGYDKDTLFYLTRSLRLPVGKYTISGMADGIILRLGDADKNDAYIGQYSASQFFSVTEEKTLTVSVRVQAYANARDTVVYPMIRLASIIDATYEPYQGTDYMLDFGKNLLPITATSGVKNGITFTVNDDGSIAANGTATSDVHFVIGKPILEPNTEYILTGAISEASRLYYNLGNGYAWDYNSGAKFTTGNSISETEAVNTLIRSGAVLNNEVFYPMIRKASVTNPTYAPYNPDMLEQTGGMIYGGKVDWHAGEMVVDYGFYNFDGAVKPYEATVIGEFTRAGFNVLQFFAMDYVYGNTDGAFSHGQYLMNWSRESAHAYANISTIIVTMPTALVGSTIDSFAEYLAAQNAAGTPVQISYKLAEPIHIPLTPAIIKSLNGVNTVYTDADDGRIEFGHETVDVIDNVMPPASPNTGTLWLDRSLTPAVLRRWSGTEWEIVNDVSLIESVQDAILLKQAKLEEEQRKTALYLKLDDTMKAVRIGQNGVTSEFRIDAFGSGVVVNDEIFSRFEASRVLFGNMEIRRPNVGGLAFDSIK